MMFAITGTDTDVGKTIVTAALAAALTAQGRRVAVYKPVQTGEPPGDPRHGGDAGVVARLAGDAVVLAEGIRLTEPMAPIPAAAADGRELPGVEAHRAEIERLREQAEVVLVEGAGGLLVPLTAAGHTLADLCGAAAGQLVVVARPGLGTLNHTALTVEAAQARGVALGGLVLGSWPQVPSAVEMSNRHTLRELCREHGVPWWDALPEGAGAWAPQQFRAASVRWFADGEQMPSSPATAGAHGD